MSSLPQNNLREQLERHSNATRSKLTLANPKPGTFCFKKRSTSDISMVQVPIKVNYSNGLANRSVNVPYNNSVTTCSLTFSNKPERPVAIINQFFTVNSKSKDSFSSAFKSSLSKSTPSASNTESPCLTKSDSLLTDKNISKSAGQDTSFCFPLDGWDDIEDFETPARGKSCPPSQAILGKKSMPTSNIERFDVASNGLEKHTPLNIFPLKENSLDANPCSVAEKTQSCLKPNQFKHTADTAEASPQDSYIHNAAKWELEESPIKRVKRRRPVAHQHSLLSDSEDESFAEPRPAGERTGL
ncbi:uncharacterized protein FYW47_009180 [Aplochiton taeniatus]